MPLTCPHVSYTAGIGSGLAAGTALGLFLKLAQAWSGARVYTLLLNVDFIPLLARPLPEWVEFALHLGFAAALGAVFARLMRRRRWPLFWGALLGIAAIPLYVPLSLLSERVPELDDRIAWLWWSAGHMLFGLTLGACGLWKRSAKVPAGPA
ncbi:hypothetical protein ACFFK0_18555 [Paenibacillus chartarius]|uniref:DUF1440 domain-containing protein n=1 Tax=Paenibacillus chartarius TaxID=747481 RepID=A0ABV6DP57_9BACL